MDRAGGIARRSIRAGLAGVVALVAVSCGCGNPASKFPELRAPDRQCAVGWYDTWIWNCHDGQHVVIYRFRGEWGCDPPVKEVAACGAKTPFERQNAGSLQQCLPGMKWSS